MVARLITIIIVTINYSYLWSQEIRERKHTRKTETLTPLLTQTVRGTVTDKETNSPLAGAVISVISVGKPIGAISDDNGKFKINEVPVGRHTLKISYLSYETLIIPEVAVTSAKEVILELKMAESSQTTDTIEIRAKIDKSKPINELALVSGRMFSVEETQRYAASINDPMRMSAVFAGVTITGEDISNAIAIRGNSPVGLLWRLEGIDIPNPNHFSYLSNGGGISMLSTNVLQNSDFNIGALPAEYGNAIAGVFDLQLRKGNSEKHEFIFRPNFLGIDIAAEGPINKNNGSSYLVNYRYSMLGLLQLLGLNLNSGFITSFQDLSFNLSFPTRKAGNFTFFGIGGLSYSKSDAKKDTSKWDYFSDRANLYATTNLGVFGITHQYLFGSRTILKNVIAYSANNDINRVDTLDYNLRKGLVYEQVYIQSRIALTSQLTCKINAQHFMRAGIIVSGNSYRANEVYLPDSGDMLTAGTQLAGNSAILQTYGQRRYANNPLITRTQAAGNGAILQTYIQWRYRPIERLTLQAGVHALMLSINQSYGIDPRLGARWQINDNHGLSIGVGRHTQFLILPAYYTLTSDELGNQLRPNKNLKPMQSDHYILGYDWNITTNWRLKIELYRQQLRRLAVYVRPIPAALINTVDALPREAMNNNGIGYNQGIDITIERFFRDGLYLLLTGSLFESKFKANDGVWRNTRYNNQYVHNVVLGKEWKLGKNQPKILGLNIRNMLAGGGWITPIDLSASAAEGTTRFNERLAYTTKLPDYWRIDFRMNYTINRKKAAHQLSLDIQNLLNRIYPLEYYYDADTQTRRTVTQNGLLLVLGYRLDF